MPGPGRRPLGTSGFSTGPLALGGNVFGWTIDEPRSFEILDAFVEGGGNLVDTADVYSVWAPGHRGGESETVLGHWLRERGRPPGFLLATKVGMEMAPDRKGLSRAHILRSVEGSLERLGVDRIDLYQAHEDDPGTPLEETLGAFRDLRDRGLIAAVGASNYTAPRLAEAMRVAAAHDLPPFVSLQPKYNLMDRTEFEGELAGVCRAHRLGVITYSSLASGFLSGKYRSPADVGKSARGARAVSRLTDRGRRILEALDQLSEESATPRSTLALSWLMDRPGVTAAIASATGVAQLEELLAATRLTLDAAAAGRLDRASA